MKFDSDVPQSHSRAFISLLSQARCLDLFSDVFEKKR
jgi:hypothetical protein